MMKQLLNRDHSTLSTIETITPNTSRLFKIKLKGKSLFIVSDDIEEAAWTAVELSREHGSELLDIIPVDETNGKATQT